MRQSDLDYRLKGPSSRRPSGTIGQPHRLTFWQRSGGLGSAQRVRLPRLSALTAAIAELALHLGGASGLNPLGPANNAAASPDAATVRPKVLRWSTAPFLPVRGSTDPQTLRPTSGHAACGKLVDGGRHLWLNAYSRKPSRSGNQTHVSPFAPRPSDFPRTTVIWFGNLATMAAEGRRPGQETAPEPQHQEIWKFGACNQDGAANEFRFHVGTFAPPLTRLALTSGPLSLRRPARP